MPVDPDFAGIREVRAHLDEPKPKLRVGDVEVVDGDAAILFGEAVVRSARTRFALARRAVIADQHRLELLGDADGDHTRLRLSPEIRLDHVDLTVTLGEPQHWNLMPFGEAGHSLPKGLTHPLNQCR